MHHHEVAIDFADATRSLRLVLLGRSIPDAISDWDREAIDVVVHVVAPPFVGEFRTIVYFHELIRLRQRLLEIESRVGESYRAQFELRDATVNLQFALHRQGHLTIDARLCEYPGDGPQLMLSIQSDQTFLTAWRDQVDSALKTFSLQL